MREVVAEAARPVMLYSIGKDSAVMLHLARKAFAPSPPPFPLLHVDTTWKFRAMYELRDRMAAESGHAADRAHESRSRGARDQPVRSWRAAHRFVEDRGAQAGARRRRIRCRVRRRAARRGEEPRQGAHLLVPLGQPWLGPEEPAARACGTSTMREFQRARASASSPSPTGPSSTCGATSSARAFRSCRSISPRRARRWCATG